MATYHTHHHWICELTLFYDQVWTAELLQWFWCFRKIIERLFENTEDEGDFDTVWGKLKLSLPYENTNSDSLESIVHDLATLLTAGRLNHISRTIMSDEF